MIIVTALEEAAEVPVAEAAAEETVLVEIIENWFE